MSSRLLDLSVWGLLGFALAFLVFRTAPSIRYYEPLEIPILAANAGSPPMTGVERTQKILMQNLFGVRVEDAGPAPAAAPENSIPPIGLALLGTVSGGPEPAAILKPEGGETTVILYLGQWIGPERLAGVEAGAVVLTSPGGERRVHVGQAVERGVSATFSQSADTVSRIRRSDINAAYGSAEEILAGVKPVPEIRNGAVVGFRMAEINDNSFFARMGLKKDDVIRSINGYRIQSYEEGLSAFNRLKGAGEVLIEVERGGQVQNFGFVIRP